MSFLPFFFEKPCIFWLDHHLYIAACPGLGHKMLSPRHPGHLSPIQRSHPHVW